MIWYDITRLLTGNNNYTGLQIKTFWLFVHLLCVFIVFRYAEFRNAERFPLARKVFTQSENENHTKDVAESRNLFPKK